MNAYLALPVTALAVALAIAGGAGAQTVLAAPVAALPTAPPTPIPSPVPTPPVLAVPRVPVLPVTSPDEADAQSYLSLARLALETCGPLGAQPPAALQQQYVLALDDFTHRRYVDAKSVSRAVIDGCAAAQP